MMTTEKTIGTTLVEGVKELLEEGFSPEDIYTIAEQIKEDADNDAIATEIAEARTKIREGFDQYNMALGYDGSMPDQMWDELFALYEDELENMMETVKQVSPQNLSEEEVYDLLNWIFYTNENKNKCDCSKKEESNPETKEKKKVSIEEFNKMISNFINKR